MKGTKTSFNCCARRGMDLYYLVSHFGYFRELGIRFEPPVLVCGMDVVPVEDRARQNEHGEQGNHGNCDPGREKVPRIGNLTEHVATWETLLRLAQANTTRELDTEQSLKTSTTNQQHPSHSRQES